MKYIYTATKLATSTVGRKFARIIEPSSVKTPEHYAIVPRPFTCWHMIEPMIDPTKGRTQGAMIYHVPAVIEPAKVETVTLYRSRDNRASRKAMARAKETAAAVKDNGTVA